MTVKHALLAFLDHEPTHGYQLHGLMEKALGDPWLVNIGQVYSTLSRLERDGLVDRQSEVEGKTTDRTVYKITGLGRTELGRWFRDPLSRDRRLRDEVYAKLMLSRISGSATPEEVLQIQRRKILGEMHDLTRMRSVADQDTGIHWILLLESAIMHLEADLKWIDLCESKAEELGEAPLRTYETRPRGRPPKRREVTE